jgi:ATP-dependent Clp protease ATP-binding subunit ClpA
MKAVMNEWKKMMISFFFIDEIHTIVVGAGGVVPRCINMFKPALAEERSNVVNYH